MTILVDQNLQMAQLQAQGAAQEKALKANGIVDPKGAPNRGKIKKLSEEFESLFLNIVLKSMRDTVNKSGLIDGGNAEDIYRSMLDNEYAEQMATQRNTGIADNIENFLLDAAGLKPEPKTARKLQALAIAPKSLALKAYEASGLQDQTKQATIGLGSLSDLKGPR